MTPEQDQVLSDVNVPSHIAIIMDGNGRWAQQRGLPRAEGHRKGAEATRDVIKTAKKLGVKYVTLYSFSIENWNRPKDEINHLMGLLRRYLKSEPAELHKNKVRLKVIGDRSLLDQDIQDQINHFENLTAENDEMTVVFALSYSGRDEIVKMAQHLIDSNVQKVDEETISKALFTKNIPDPDLLIRTSGEMRISNFLLWQMAYTEMHFTPTLWPDFNEDDLIKAIEDYAQRQRRFGKVEPVAEKSK